MAEKKPFSSIIDEILSEREPDWKDLDLTDAKKSGEEVQDRTHQYVDEDFMDEIAESASKHTPVWGPKNGAQTYEQRIAEKEAAQPRVNAVKADWRKDAHRFMDDYKDEHGDNDSLLNEVTESLESAYKTNNLAENSAEKKSISDAQVQKYVRDLLNKGMSPAKIATQLKKLAEIELFNHQSATDYLQRNAGLIGLAYLEPNTYMDKNSPTYEHTASNVLPEALKQEANEYLKGMAAQGFVPVPETITEIFRRHNQEPDPELLARLCKHSSKTSSSNQCIQQKKAWDNAGIKPQAHSVKQVTACSGCAFFKKDASGKVCNLYHLPVVANEKELSQIVNHLTPGVPEKKKHAALVQIANGDGKRVATPKVAEQTNIVKTADAKVRNQEKRASYEYKDEREASHKFSSEHIVKLHAKGASLQQIYKWADAKFGSVDVSFAFRGFVTALKKNAKGKIVVASNDLTFLNSIGIRNESFVGAAKCASCVAHKTAAPDVLEDEMVDIKPCSNCDADPRFFSYDEEGEVFCTSCGEIQPISQRELFHYWDSGKTGSKVGSRVPQKFASRTPDAVRQQQKEAKTIVVTASKVRSLHQAGHSIAKIYNAAVSKVGSLEARKVVAAFIEDIKKNPGKIAVSAEDRAFLEGKLGFKPEQVRMLNPNRRPVTQVVASVPDDVNVIAYPGMEKQAGEKKHVDGHSILAEYDLTGGHEMQDIDTSGPKRDDIQMNDTFKVELD